MTINTDGYVPLPHMQAFYNPKEGKLILQEEKTGKKLTFIESNHESLSRLKKGTRTAIAKQTPTLPCPPTAVERIDLINTLETGHGGFTAVNLAKIGVAWPPQKGWRQNAIENGW